MGKKIQKNLRIESGISSEFAKICERKKLNQNEVVEDLMKQYIARDGESLFDELYAPKITKMVQKGIDNQINRLAKMLYQTQTNSAAALHAIPFFHIEMMKYMHEAFPNYLDKRLLAPTPKNLAKDYTMEHNGQRVINQFQNMGRDNVAKRKDAITDEDIQHTFI